MNEPIKSILKCFPEGKHKALTMSYDDGRPEDRRLVSIFNEHGIKGTFHLNSGLLENRIQPEEYAELYAGHEISCHTLTHPSIARCPAEQVVWQVMEDRKRLEAAAGYPVRGLSYPNGSYSDSIKALLPSLGIRYSRIVGNSEGFSLPDDPYAWKATCHHNHKLMELAETFVGLNRTQHLYLMYVWGHSYEFTDYKNWELIEEFCRFAGGHDNIWYATNIEIMDYLDLFDRLQFSADGGFVFNPSAQSAWLNINGTIVEAKGGALTRL